MHVNRFFFGNTPTQNIADGLVATSSHTGPYIDTRKPDKPNHRSRLPIIVKGDRVHLPHIYRHAPQPALQKMFLL